MTGTRRPPRPSAFVAIDVAVLTVVDKHLHVLLAERDKEPFHGCWALPGVFMRPELEHDFPVAARRALRTKAGVDVELNLRQLLTWHNQGRDPRGWVVSVVYYALAPHEVLAAAVRPGAVELARLPNAVPEGAGRVDPAIKGEDVWLAFDHAVMLDACVARLRRDAEWSDAPFDALPERFTLRQLQSVHEAITGRSLNKDSFRRSVTKSRNLVVPTAEWQADVGHRPAQLYRRNPG